MWLCRKQPDRNYCSVFARLSITYWVIEYVLSPVPPPYIFKLLRGLECKYWCSPPQPAEWFMVERDRLSWGQQVHLQPHRHPVFTWSDGPHHTSYFTSLAWFHSSKPEFQLDYTLHTVGFIFLFFFFWMKISVKMALDAIQCTCQICHTNSLMMAFQHQEIPGPLVTVN